jgi:ribosomal protein S18 acetylase RimI-like enzyme
MTKITYHDFSNGPIEQCRNLCNALMQLQAERSNKHTKVLRSMNFETRLKPSFENAEKRFLYMAHDDIKPIGYIFCEACTVTEEIKNMVPDWAKDYYDGTNGLFPPDLPTPVMTAHLNNLYVLPEYQGLQIGKILTDNGIKWMRSVPDVHYLFVHVSNGNTAGAFYEKYGFHFSHDVFQGMIDAYVQKL